MCIRDRYVGIGIETPTQALDVSGNISITNGNLNVDDISMNSGTFYVNSDLSVNGTVTLNGTTNVSLNYDSEFSLQKRLFVNETDICFNNVQSYNELKTFENGAALSDFVTELDGTSGTNLKPSHNTSYIQKDQNQRPGFCMNTDATVVAFCDKQDDIIRVYDITSEGVATSRTSHPPATGSDPGYWFMAMSGDGNTIAAYTNGDSLTIITYLWTGSSLSLIHI